MTSTSSVTASVAPNVQGFFHEDTNTISYVVSDPHSSAALVIDPVLDFDPAAGNTTTTAADALLAHIADKGLEVELVLETHVHADHLTAAPYLAEKLGVRVGIGEHVRSVQRTFGEFFNEDDSFARDGSQFDRLLKDDETFTVGHLSAQVLWTPGHTPACVTYLIGDAAFVGDTLFMPDFGTARCDFPGGDARTLYHSIQRVLSLDPNTRLFMCHDYMAEGRNEYAWETTVAQQRADNVHVRDDISEEAFVAMRTTRDATLSMPRLLLPSVQVNMRAGQFPTPESNGVSYLKLPIRR